jgi:peptidoglycan/LPS O-acetylase OafA/YrhL
MDRSISEPRQVTQPEIAKNGIYAVRGFAAFLVLFLHVTSLLIPQEEWINRAGNFKFLFPWLFRGEIGVGVFIFLSGFLLSLNIPTDFKAWKGFYIRRFSRIYPVYGVVLLISISITRQWDFHGFLNALFLFPNFPGTLWPAPYLSTGWSLGVEWTLYLIFPLILASISFRRLNILILVLLLEVTILYGHLVGTDFHTLVYGSIIGRAVEFILGITLAIYFNQVRNLSRVKLLTFLIFSYALFHLWCTWYLLAGGSISESYLRALQPIAESLFGFFLIVMSQFNFPRFMDLTLKAFTLLGIISYPFYLSHLTVLDFVQRVLTSNKLFGVIPNVIFQSILIFFISIAVAWLLHVAIEKPGMRLGRNSKE